MEKSLSFKRSSKWDSASCANPFRFRFFQGVLLLGVALFLFGSEARAFSSRKSTEAKVWIRKNDGSVSCEPDRGESLEKAERELRRQGVSVLARRKTSDGLIRAMVCGMPQGSFNEFQIPGASEPRARELGYDRVTSQGEDSR